MARFIQQIGKIAKDLSEAARLVRKREEFSGTLVTMMDGGKGRRYAGKWRVVYDNESNDPTAIKAKTYTVYSYGDHWPMYVWDDMAQQWYGNATKCWSRTTAKHTNQFNPGGVNCYLDMQDLEQIISHGTAGWVRDKLGSAP